MLWKTVVVVVAVAVQPRATNALVSVRTTSRSRNHRRRFDSSSVSSSSLASSSSSSSSSSASLMENLSDVGYQVTVKKPLGIVFGENRPPYAGLVVDDVEPGMNGGAVGIRVGDQLMSVNGEYVISGDFDTVMEKLRNYDSPLNLQLYRGSVSSLFTIVMNKNGLVVAAEDNDNNNDDDATAIIMDENYEPPIITAEEYEENKISVSQVASEALKSLGGLFNGGLKSILTSSSETIQLEGDDAKSGQKNL